MHEQARDATRPAHGQTRFERAAVSHPSTNRARCRLTLLSKASARLTAQTGLPCLSVFSLEESPVTPAWAVGSGKATCRRNRWNRSIFLFLRVLLSNTCYEAAVQQICQHIEHTEKKRNRNIRQNLQNIFQLFGDSSYIILQLYWSFF